MAFRPLFLPIFLATSVTLTACGGGGGSGPGEEVVSLDDTQPQPVPAAPKDTQQLSGGNATVFDTSADAFSSRSANMTDIDRIKQFNLGNDFFENPWVAGSASTSSRDGVGALLNNNACQDCHIRDGRGHAPNVSLTENGTDFSSILLKAARANISSADRALIEQSLLGKIPDSSVGGQLQHDAIPDIMKEVELSVGYTTVAVNFSDGTRAVLRKPLWQLTSNYADSGFDFDDDTVFSARVAPPMIGMGLLALIPEADILAGEDPGDSNGDGISGRANYVWSLEDQAVTLGRFGWRAGQSSVLEQSAGAFANDMGLTSRLQLMNNCMPHQADCLAAPNGNGDSVSDYDYEVADPILDAVAFYSSHLGVPARRDVNNAEVQAGKSLFTEAGCGSCHVASYVTSASTEQPELSEQVIFPYTDLLLHDMGAELADFNIDNQPADDSALVEFLATAREWRTPPLWGIGLAKTVDPTATFLHDGRARTILEAVLWHGGEAEQSRQDVLQMTAQERDQLLTFLNDL
jgi:CxxC motif-containing protein (DUF1111 family)